MDEMELFPTKKSMQEYLKRKTKKDHNLKKSQLSYHSPMKSSGGGNGKKSFSSAFNNSKREFQKTKSSDNLNVFAGGMMKG